VSGAAARMKGIRWERAVANYYGTSTTRSLRPGVHDDGGDIAMPNSMLVECKDHGRWQVATWFDQIERKCGDEERPVLVLKRRQQPVAYGLVVMRVGDLWLPEL